MSYRSGSSRSRSRSPEKQIKLHVSDLPVGFPHGQLVSTFSQYGRVMSARVIRNGPKGFPLRQHCYAFVEMQELYAADKALAELNKQGWKITMSRDSQSAVNSVPQSQQMKDLIWSGFLTRSHKYRVGVDVYLYKGDESDFPTTLHHLDIAYRAPLSELYKQTPKTLLLIEASNDTQQSVFSSYIQYFKSKERAGFIPLGRKLLYMLPPDGYAQTLCKEIRPEQMLGVINEGALTQLRHALESTPAFQ